MSIPAIERATEKAQQDFQFRPPEGIVKHGDFSFFYHDGRRYRVKVVFVLEEQLA